MGRGARRSGRVWVMLHVQKNVRGRADVICARDSRTMVDSAGNTAGLRLGTTVGWVRADAGVGAEICLGGAAGGDGAEWMAGESHESRWRSLSTTWQTIRPYVASSLCAALGSRDGICLVRYVVGCGGYRVFCAVALFPRRHGRPRCVGTSSCVRRHRATCRNGRERLRGRGDAIWYCRGYRDRWSEVWTILGSASEVGGRRRAGQLRV